VNESSDKTAIRFMDHKNALHFYRSFTTSHGIPPIRKILTKSVGNSPSIETGGTLADLVMDCISARINFVGHAYVRFNHCAVLEEMTDELDVSVLYIQNMISS